MRKILIYSECFVYSGSENIVENILRSSRITQKYDVSFYYAYNAQYAEAVKVKYAGLANIFPLKILSSYSSWGYPLRMGALLPSRRRNYLRMMYFISTCLRRLGWHNVFNLTNLYRLFRKQKPDLVFINNGGYPGAHSCRMAALAARLAGIPRIIFVVNNLAIPSKYPLEKILDRQIDTGVDRFVTASEAARETLIRTRRFGEEKCVSIPNTLSRRYEKEADLGEGLLRKEFSVERGTIVLGSVGLLIPRKGYHVLIEAMARLKRKGENRFRLFIFGEGEERKNLERKIRDLDLEDLVFLPGYRDNIMKYVRDFDIFILPSVANEDFPYVILEAMLLAKPVIGTRVAGIPEQIMDGYNGYIVEPGDVDGLAGAIGRLGPNLGEYGDRGRERYMNNYRNSIVTDRYADLFDSLLGKS